MEEEWVQVVTPAEARSIASTLSREFHIRIEQGNGWAYSFSKKTLYYNPEDLWRVTDIEVIGNLLHEVGHAKYSVDPMMLYYPVMMPEDHKDKLFNLVNAIEDFRIEDLMRDFYPYALEYLPEYGFKTKYILEVWQSRLITVNPDGSRKIPKFVQYCMIIYSEIAGLEISEANPEVLEIVAKTKHHAIAARYSDSNQEVLDRIMQHIYPLVKHWFDEFEDPQVQPRRIMVSGREEEGKYPSYDELYARIKPLLNPTVESFRKILTDNIFDKFAGKYSSGRKLISRSLYQFKLGNYKLFQKKIEAKTKAYVFALLVDESGSMRGEPTTEAVKSAILFANVLDRLNIPFGLYGFNAKYRKYKVPTDPFRKKFHKVFEEMMANTHGDGCGNNNDADAVYNTAEDLFSYGDKKVMIVLSDGEYAPDQSEEHPDLLKQVQEATKKGIKVIGVGIQTTAVQRYYGTHVVVDNIEELPRELVRILKKEFS